MTPVSSYREPDERNESAVPPTPKPALTPTQRAARQMIMPATSVLAMANVLAAIPDSHSKLFGALGLNGLALSLVWLIVRGCIFMHESMK